MIDITTNKSEEIVNILNRTSWKPGEIFDIKKSTHECVGAMDLEVTPKQRFDGDSGYGIYLIWFDSELLYLGSFCGPKSIVRDRWSKHLSTITLSFRDVSLVQLRSPDPTLNSLLGMSTKGDLENYLLRQKEKLSARYSGVMDNPRLMKEVLNPLLELNSSSPKAHLNHLMGDRVNTSRKRVSVANKYWDQFRSLSPSDICARFTFDYFRINPLARDEGLSVWLYDQTRQNESKAVKKKYVQSNIEAPLISRLVPPANGTRDEVRMPDDIAYHTNAIQIVDEIQNYASSR